LPRFKVKSQHPQIGGIIQEFPIRLVRTESVHFLQVDEFHLISRNSGSKNASVYLPTTLSVRGIRGSAEMSSAPRGNLNEGTGFSDQVDKFLKIIIF
jgi:hypothetical protein